MEISKLMLAIGASALLAACGGAEGNESNQSGAATAERAAEREAPRTRSFVNHRDRAVSPRLRERYTDFSFDYPADWTVADQEGPRSSNYVEVEGPMSNGAFTYDVAFGSAQMNGIEQASPEEVERVLRQAGEEMRGNWRNHRLVSAGRQRLGRYDTLGWRFTGTVNAGGRDVPVRGRADMLFPDGRSTGLYIITLVSERADEFPELEDVGETGVLRDLFRSLRVGEEAGGARDAASRRDRDDEDRRAAEDDSALEPR